MDIPTNLIGDSDISFSAKDDILTGNNELLFSSKPGFYISRSRML